MNNISHHVAIALVLTCATGCAPEEQEESASASSAIRGGTTTDERPEVGMLQVPGGMCTATLIRPRIVLTASHCVFEDVGGGHDSRGTISGSFTYRLDGVDSEVALDRYSRKRDAMSNAFQSATDVALVRLKEEPRGLTPASLASRSPRRGDAMTAFGYGTNDCGTWDFWKIGTTSTAFTKRRGDYRWGGPVYVTCPGDSGGPHFGTDGAVYAVTSGGRVFGNVSASVAANADWIRTEIVELER